MEKLSLKEIVQFHHIPLAQGSSVMPPESATVFMNELMAWLEKPGSFLNGEPNVILLEQLTNTEQAELLIFLSYFPDMLENEKYRRLLLAIKCHLHYFLNNKKAMQ